MDLKKARVCTWAVFLLGAAVILVSIFLRQGGIAVAGVLLLGLVSAVYDGIGLHAFGM